MFGKHKHDTVEQPGTPYEGRHVKDAECISGIHQYGEDGRCDFCRDWDPNAVVPEDAATTRFTD